MFLAVPLIENTYCLFGFTGIGVAFLYVEVPLNGVPSSLKPPNSISLPSIFFPCIVSSIVLYGRYGVATLPFF